MKWDFEKCVEHVIEAEGGYSDHVADSGGATQYGITHKVLATYRGKSVTKNDVKNLQLSEAKAIYKAFYWDKMKLDLLDNDEKSLILFDQGVNRGVGTAMKQAQMICNIVNDSKLLLDGINGANTSKAIKQIPVTKFCRLYLQGSMHAYASICVRNNSQIVFLKGWLNRVYKLMDKCWV